MKRDLQRLSRESFDVLVVGGGIFGICTAWEAVSRGLSVALIESVDFGHATSANCFKVIHGGVRYMQHADLARVRASVKERSVFLNVAPQLARPLPIVIPTYGKGKQGKAFLHAGMTAYDLITADRNRSIADPSRQIPSHQMLGRDEVLSQFPWLGESSEQSDFTGGVLFYDGQMYSPERLALAFVRTAAEAGACVANYVRAQRFIRHGKRVTGVEAIDVISGDRFAIEAKVTINAAGPWAERLLADTGADFKLTRACTFSRDAWFLVRRPWVSENALALQARNRDPDALLSRNARHLFVVPWRGQTIIGVWHVVTDMAPDAVDVPDTDLEAFVSEVNWACPDLNITMNEVGCWNAGLVLFADVQKSKSNLSYGKRSRIIDHSEENGVDGLVSLIGVRYTTARGEACRVMKLISRKLQLSIAPSTSHRTRLHGGDIDDFDGLRQQVAAELGTEVDSATVGAVSSFHGSDYRAVLACAVDASRTIAGSHVLRAEVTHACRHEMAVRLDDMVMRRTELIDGCHPGAAVIEEVAGIMASELGWSDSRRAQEIDIVNRSLHHRRYREL